MASIVRFPNLHFESTFMLVGEPASIEEVSTTKTVTREHLNWGGESATIEEASTYSKTMTRNRGGEPATIGVAPSGQWVTDRALGRRCATISELGTVGDHLSWSLLELGTVRDHLGWSARSWYSEGSMR